MWGDGDLLPSYLEEVIDLDARSNSCGRWPGGERGALRGFFPNMIQHGFQMMPPFWFGFVVVCVCVCVSTPGPRVHHQHFNHSFAGRGAVSLIPSTAQRRRWFETVTFGEDAL